MHCCEMKHAAPTSPFWGPLPVPPEHVPLLHVSPLGQPALPVQGGGVEPAHSPPVQAYPAGQSALVLQFELGTHWPLVQVSPVRQLLLAKQASCWHVPN
jgi:hypothetical protein